MTEQGRRSRPPLSSCTPDHEEGEATAEAPARLPFFELPEARLVFCYPSEGESNGPNPREWKRIAVPRFGGCRSGRLGVWGSSLHGSKVGLGASTTHLQARRGRTWRRDISHLGVAMVPETIAPGACSRAGGSDERRPLAHVSRERLLTEATSFLSAFRKGRSLWGGIGHGCKEVRSLSTSCPLVVGQWRFLSDRAFAAVQTGWTRVQLLVPRSGGKTLETGTPYLHACKEGVSLFRGRHAREGAGCTRAGEGFARMQRGRPGCKSGFGDDRAGGG